jgi:hypothetical protein
MGILMKLILLMITLVISGCVEAANSVSHISKSFVMYHDIKYKNMPTLPLERVVDIASNDKQAYWSIGDDKKVDFPSELRTRTLALSMPIGQNIYFNIEHLPTRQGYATHQQMAESMQKLSNIAYWIKSERPNIKIGFYTILPQRETTAGYWTDEWRARNDYFIPLSSYVDTIYPSLYTFYNDHQGWVDYAKENVLEARKYGKPIIAFIWPQYHASSPTNPDEFIDGEYWRLQLETLYLIADGVLIWSGGCCNWPDVADETDPSNWWYQTIDFMESKGLK